MDTAVEISEVEAHLLRRVLEHLDRMPLGTHKVSGVWGFDSRSVCRIIGVTERQLRHWDWLGLAQPSLQETGGKSGVVRIYSRDNAKWLARVRLARRAGFTPKHIRWHGLPAVRGSIRLPVFECSQGDCERRILVKSDIAL